MYDNISRIRNGFSESDSPEVHPNRKVLPTRQVFPIQKIDIRKFISNNTTYISIFMFKSNNYRFLSTKYLAKIIGRHIYFLVFLRIDNLKN